MKKFVVVVLVLVVLLLAVGRPVVSAGLRKVVAAAIPVQRVTPAELATWEASPSRVPPLILDARTDAEYAVSHLDGAHRVDPAAPDLSVLGHAAHDTPIVVYCNVGIRSGKIAQALQSEEYTKVWVLDGGIFRWANEGRPLVAQGGPASTVHPYDRVWGWFLEPARRAPL
jgi:rhodanese-related sulfurtransferase